MSNQDLHLYYKERKPQVLADFKESLQLARPYFEKLLPNHAPDDLFDQFLVEFESVYPALPYVGGASGRMTPFFEQGAGVISVGRVLRAREIDVSLIGELMKRTFLEKLAKLPLQERYAMGRQFLSPENQTHIRSMAFDSEERKNPGDFVYRFIEAVGVEGDESFEFGIDYTECGFCKLCKNTGDEDLLPHLCAIDAEFYALRGIELQRTMTLAAGDSHCNFRFRRVRDTSQIPDS